MKVRLRRGTWAAEDVPSNEVTRTLEVGRNAHIVAMNARRGQALVTRKAMAPSKSSTSTRSSELNRSESSLDDGCAVVKQHRR